LACEAKAFSTIAVALVLEEAMNKLTWLAGATTLTILVASGDAKANVFSVDGTFTVPVSGLFEIVADGAQGGAGFFDGGGLGGEATGEFALTAGETLNVVVGAMGTGSVGALMGGGTGADGGGASSVSFGAVGLGLPLVVGGGGGGAGARSEPGGPGGGTAGVPGSGPGGGTESMAGGGGYTIGDGPGTGGVPGSGGSGGDGGTAVGGVPQYGEGYTNGGGGVGGIPAGRPGSPLSTRDPWALG
jgi:hypothetical protein